MIPDISTAPLTAISNKTLLFQINSAIQAFFSHRYNCINGEIMTDPDTLFCANHPDRETFLRCNRCEKPICIHCAVLTEVGYRCKECVRGQQAAYYNAQPHDLPIAAGAALVLAALAGVLAYLFLGALGWFSFIGAILAGPAVGSVIVEAVRRVMRKRRARRTKPVAATMTVVGVLLGGAAIILFTWGGVDLRGFLAGVFFRLDVLLLAGLAASTVYTRLL